MNGILNILKPPGVTSHGVVSLVRRMTGIKKVGHTGTLDPNAAGVLPICIGQATKISQFLLDSQKKYRAELYLGIETDTQDQYGEILKQQAEIPSREEIKKAIMSFVGEYDQIPPMYSALKRDGKKLYELAREGIEVQREPRRVQIHEISIIEINGNRVIFDVLCSKGTYIRTLCKDIGESLGCGGMMSFLLRTATGEFQLENTITLEALEATQDIEKLLYPVDYPLRHLPKISVNPGAERAVLNGNKIPSHLWLKGWQAKGEDLARVYLKDQFIGIAIVKSGQEEVYLKFSRLFV